MSIQLHSPMPVWSQAPPPRMKFSNGDVVVSRYYNTVRNDMRRTSVEHLTWPQLAKKWIDSNCVDSVRDVDVRADVLWARCSNFPMLPGFDARLSNSMLWLAPFFSWRTDTPFDASFSMCRNTGSPAEPDTFDDPGVGALPPDTQMFYDGDTQCFYYFNTTLGFSSWDRPHTDRYERLRLATEVALHTCQSTITQRDSLGIVRIVHEDGCQLNAAGRSSQPQPPRGAVTCDAQCAVVKSTAENKLDINHAWTCRVLRARGGIAAFRPNGPDAEQIASAGVAGETATLSAQAVQAVASGKQTPAVVSKSNQVAGGRAAVMNGKQRTEFGHHIAIRKHNAERQLHEALAAVSYQQLRPVPNVTVNQVMKRPPSSSYRLHLFLMQPGGPWSTLSSSDRRLYDLRTAVLATIYNNELQWLGLTPYMADLIRGLKLVDMPVVQPAQLQVPPVATALTLLYLVSDMKLPQPEWSALKDEERQVFENQLEQQKEAYAQGLRQLHLTAEQASILRSMYASGIRPNNNGCADVGGSHRALTDGELWARHVARSVLRQAHGAEPSDAEVELMGAQIWVNATEQDRVNLDAIVKERRKLYDSALLDSSFLNPSVPLADPLCPLCALAVPQHRRMVCTSCSLSHHCYCTTPPLTFPSAVPWTCRTCRDNSNAAAHIQNQ
jgi:hypothetical protein